MIQDVHEEEKKKKLRVEKFYIYRFLCNIFVYFVSL